MNITIRNWVIVYFIVEYEQGGSDRAAYGVSLLKKLATNIKIKGLTAPELSRCRQFYLTYPEILGSLSQEFKSLSPILGSVTQKFDKLSPIRGSVTQKSEDIERQSISKKYFTEIVEKISYTHLVELLKIKDENKRRFYEMLVIKNTLSVRELERQIVTLTYERLGISKDPGLALNELGNSLIPEKVNDAIKSIYFFDFLKIPGQHLIHENQLEEALIDNLQNFILELGIGFCFESRQKRILIDDEYCFVDLVFYHRILKCHVLIELKVDKFKHEYLSQLNTYVAYYNEVEKRPDDNPSIGILLCTEKGKKMVEYAMAGITQKLFVSKYLIELPDKDKLIEFIEKEIRKI